MITNEAKHQKLAATWLWKAKEREKSTMMPKFHIWQLSGWG